MEGIKISEPLPTKENIAIKFPTHLVSLWIRSNLKKPEKSICRTVLVTPDGKKNKGVELEVDLESFPRIRTIFKIEGLPITVEGIYRFIIEHRPVTKSRSRWIEAAKIPLYVEFPPKEVKKATSKTKKKTPRKRRTKAKH